MAVTQTQFERELQVALAKEGFEFNKKDMQDLLTITGNTVQDCLKRDQAAIRKNGGGNPVVVVRGLGRFTIRSYKARMGRNPATGATIKIKASKRLRVTPPKALKEALKVK